MTLVAVARLLIWPLILKLFPPGWLVAKRGTFYRSSALKRPDAWAGYESTVLCAL